MPKKGLLIALVAGFVGGIAGAITVLLVRPAHDAAPMAGSGTPQVRAQASAPLIFDICEAELKKYCDGVKPGEGRIKKCLLDHSANLSSECRTSAENLKVPPSK